MKGITISIFSALFFLPIHLAAQVEAELTIQNQTISGSDFQFDVYLRTTAASTGDLFLGDADFVLTFNSANFTNPVLTKVGTAPGNCTFVPTDPVGSTGLNTLLTRINYFNNTSPAAVVGNELVINLAGPTPADQQAFDDGVARIDGVASEHRLGTFQLSGYDSGNTDLQWKTSGGGSETQVFTLENTPPFNASAAGIVAIDPPPSAPLPVELTKFTARLNDAKVVELEWETASETNNAFFTVERSSDGAHWYDLIKKEGAGNSFGRRIYLAIDDQPLAGTAYYRLRQTDFDGKESYSKVEAVFWEKEILVSVSPNPATDFLQLKLEAGVSGFEVEIMDLEGQVVLRRGLQGQQHFGINVSGLASGLYFMKIKTKNGVQAVRFEKIK